MSSLTRRKKEKLDAEFEAIQQKMRYAPAEAAKSRAAQVKLLNELEHVRTCKSFDLKDETQIISSNALKKRILCGVGFITVNRSGYKVKIEILHLTNDRFRVMVDVHPFLLKENYLDFKIRFRHLAKFMTFILPLLKDD